MFLTDKIARKAFCVGGIFLSHNMFFQGTINASPDYDYLYRFYQSENREKDEIYNRLPVIAKFGVNCTSRDLEKLLSPETETMVNMHYAKYNRKLSAVSLPTFINKTSLSGEVIRNYISYNN